MYDKHLTIHSLENLSRAWLNTFLFFSVILIYLVRKNKLKVIVFLFFVFFSPSHEHHLLPPGEKVLVVVSEKETSSIIAYTLR